MRLFDVLRETPGALLERDAEITGITYDSRAVRPGYLFVAVVGTELDGRRFIPDAVARGAAAVVTEPGDGATAGVVQDVGFALVPDARRALSQASNLFYQEPSKSLAVVGVTGTKGKTTTCHLVKAALDACGEKTGLVGTLHNIVGKEERPVLRTTPESAEIHSLMREMVDVGSTAVTMEVSSHALVLQRVEDIRFAAAVLTNIGHDHLDFHKTLDSYAGAKRHLFELLQEGSVAVLNSDEPFFPFFASAASVPVITYGLGEKSNVRAEGLDMDGNGTSFSADFEGKREKVRLSLPGRFNVYNALAAAAAAYGLGKDTAAIAAGLSSAARVRGRVEVVSGPGDFTVWVDYAHTPESLRDVLALAREVSKGKVIAVFGCGGDRDNEKRPVMGKVAGDIADFVVLTDDNPRTEDEDRILDQIEVGVKESRSACAFSRVRDRREAIHLAVNLAGDGDVVVLAGKGHETYQRFKDATVDLDDTQVAADAMRSRAGGV